MGPQKRKVEGEVENRFYSLAFAAVEVVRMDNLELVHQVLSMYGQTAVQE